MASIGVKDADWIRQCYLLPVGAISDEDNYRRYYTSAKWKYSDTTLGGDLVINPLPQFTRYADVKVKNIFGVGAGMGRKYSETIHDNQLRVHLRFGVPEYNSLTGFFGSFYDPAMSSLVRKGRDTSAMWKIGFMTGTVLTLPLQLANVAMGVARYWLGAPATRFAYLKPTMPLYWNAYQSMLNTLAANMGITLGAQEDRYSNWNVTKKALDISTIPNAQTEIMRKMLPQNWITAGSEGLGVNIYAVSRRAQMYADAYHRQFSQMLDNSRSLSELRAQLRALESGDARWDLSAYGTSVRTLEKYVDDYISSDLGAAGRESSETQQATTTTTTGTTTTNPQPGEATTAPEAAEQAASWRGGASVKETDISMGNGARGVWDHMLAEAREGSGWITYRVDNPGTISESISTSVGESALAQTINSASSSKRKLQFNLAGGNIGDGAIASAIEGFLGGATDLIAGGAASVGLGGLGVLVGAGLADVPKDWENTVVNLPKSDFTIQLRSWSGDKVSRFQNLMVPLVGLLAGSLPRSVGPSAYERPFMCEMFFQGRQQVRYGVIDSVNITRGVGNVGWTQDGEPLGIDVTFSVLDLSSIMHMPIAAGLMGGLSLTSPVSSIARYFFGDDTVLSDYLGTLSGMSLADRIYKWEVLERRWKNAQLDFDSFFSVAHMATAVYGTLPGRFIQAISNQSSRQ